MEKRLFQILEEMNQKDCENNTRTVAISNIFISGKKVKQGSKIEMGCDEQCLLDIFNKKSIPILLIVDKEEYFKIENKK